MQSLSTHMGDRRAIKLFKFAYYELYNCIQVSNYCLSVQVPSSSIYLVFRFLEFMNHDTVVFFVVSPEHNLRYQVIFGFYIS